MKNLDTHTVLEIIKMIDTQIDYKAKHLLINTDKEYHIAVGQEIALQELSNHLQSYIEGQLNAEENASADEEYYGEGHCPNCGGLIDLHGPKCAEE